MRASHFDSAAVDPKVLTNLALLSYFWHFDRV